MDYVVLFSQHEFSPKRTESQIPKPVNISSYQNCRGASIITPSQPVAEGRVKPQLFQSPSKHVSHDPNNPAIRKMPSESQEKPASAAQARQVIDVFHEISTLLVRSRCPHPPCLLCSSHNPTQNANLDRQTISVCISLIENGVNPEALAVSYFSSGPVWLGFLGGHHADCFGLVSRL